MCESDGSRVVGDIQSWPLDRRSRLVVDEGGRERRSETSWNSRSYDATQARRLLAKVPELEHVATFDFTYDLDQPLELDGEHRDVVLILRRR